MQPVTIPDHPLLRHKLTLLRDRYTPTGNVPPGRPGNQPADGL